MVGEIEGLLCANVGRETRRQQYIHSRSCGDNVLCRWKRLVGGRAPTVRHENSNCQHFNTTVKCFFRCGVAKGEDHFLPEPKGSQNTQTVNDALLQEASLTCYLRHLFPAMF